MSGKFALIIGNTEYIDPGLAQLTAPGKDTEDFARILKDQDIGAFDNVNILLNQSSSTVIEAVDEFFDQRKPDDLLLLYFSGHGVRDELGSLYLAVKNTIRPRLRSTAIKSDYIREVMDQSRSRRQVVILDCCNSGAFPQGTKAEVGGMMGMVSALQGYGRFVLTASDATQYAWEGNQIIGETQNSLFTHFLVKGLEGEADSDGDGRITIDELYDYAYEGISKLTPKQTPTKSISKQEGEIVLRQFTRIEDIKPLPLPDELISEIEDLRPFVREAAVQRLEKILKGKSIGMARSAIKALERVATDENTTRRVSQMAMQVLESFRQVEQKAEEERRAREEAERLAMLKAEEERLAREKAEAERKAKEEAEKLARAQAERKAAEAEAARLKAEREAAELAAREATEKAEKEKAEKEAAEREADRLKDEREAAREKAEREAALKAEREAMKLASRKKAEREAAENAEREAVELASRKKAEREAKEKIVGRDGKVARTSWLTFGAIGGGIIALALCGYGATRLFPSIFTGAPTQPPATQAPIVQPANGNTYTIKIASQSPLSGGQSLLGVDIKRGAELALEQLGGPLRDMGFDVQLAPYDDQATPDVGVANAKNIVADASILCGVGHLNSGVMIPSSEEYHTANLPFVSPANTNPVVTTRGYLEVNRVVGRDDVQAPVAEEYAFTELGAQTVYIIHDKTAYGQGVAELFRTAAEEDGLAVLGFEGTDETANFDAIIPPILAVNPDVLYFAGIYDQGSVFFKQARDAGYEGTFMGTDGMDTSELAALAGDALTKGGGMVYTSVAGPASAYPKAAQFATDFEAKFGAYPQPYAAQGYDSAGICLKAIENAAKEAGGVPSRLAVANAIRALTYNGITATIRFNDIGDRTTAKYFIIKVNATTADTWYTNEIVGELEFPPPQ